MNQAVQTIEQRIEAKLDNETTRELAVSDRAGGVVFANVKEVMEFAKLMAISGIAVRKHLRGNPGACLGIVVQALEWRMSPYAVANKSYLVNDQIAYEAQMIHAVVLSRAPIRGRPKIEYRGDGAKRRCKVSVELSDALGQWVDYESPEIGSIPVKNSPLWKADPDQQLFYFSSRSLARRHFPDVILGVYARDEFEIGMVPDAEVRDVTPRAQPKTLAGKMDALAAKPTAHDPETGDIQNSGDEPELTRDEAGNGGGAGGPVESQATARQEGQDGEVLNEASSSNSGDEFPGDRLSVIQVARERGREAKESGLGTRAMPGEYRAEGREAEAEAWLDGHKSVAMAEG